MTFNTYYKNNQNLKFFFWVNYHTLFLSWSALEINIFKKIEKKINRILIGYNRSWWPRLDMNWKPQQLSIFFSIPNILKFLVLANFKITLFVQDFVSKNSLRNSVELSKNSNDFKKVTLHSYIFRRRFWWLIQRIR